MGHYVAERLLLEAFVKTNLPGPIHDPNVGFTRPAAGPSHAPSHWWLWDLDYDEVEMRSAGRTRWVNGVLYLEIWVQSGAGAKQIPVFMDLLEGLVDSRTASNFWFNAIQPGPPGEFTETGKSSPQWYGRSISLPYKRSSEIAVNDIVAIAGIGATSTVIDQEAHGFQVLDAIGFDVSLGKRRKVKALEGEPRCEGLVTQLLGPDRYVRTMVGDVTLPGHGKALGNYFLSQSTNGALTIIAPDSGVAHLMVTVYDADKLSILSLPEMVL